VAHEKRGHKEDAGTDRQRQSFKKHHCFTKYKAPRHSEFGLIYDAARCSDNLEL